MATQSVKNTIRVMRDIYSNPNLTISTAEVQEILDDIEQDYDKERR